MGHLSVLISSCSRSKYDRMGGLDKTVLEAKGSRLRSRSRVLSSWIPEICSLFVSWHGREEVVERKQVALPLFLKGCSPCQGALTLVITSKPIAKASPPNIFTLGMLGMQHETTGQLLSIARGLSLSTGISAPTLQQPESTEVPEIYPDKRRMGGKHRHASVSGPDKYLGDML